MATLMDYLKKAVDDEASDLFIVSGAPVSEKLEGVICFISEEKILPPQSKELLTEIYALADRSMDEYIRIGDDDFSFSVSGLARFRVNTYMPGTSRRPVIT